MKQNKLILLAFFLSGAAALIYEVTWIKPISVVYQSTIYVISIILTAFMLGLALGSIIAGKIIDRIKKPLLLYAFFQLGIGLYCLLLLNLFNVLPLVNHQLLAIHTPFQYNLIQFFSIFLLLLVPTTLMGATFPVIAKSYVHEKIGKNIGEIYSVNNMGAVIGVLSAGFILIPRLGIRGTIIFAAVLNTLTAFLIIFHSYRNFLKLTLPVTLVLFIIFAHLGNYNLTNLYTKGIFGFIKKDLLQNKKIIFYEEGLYGSIAVSEEGSLGAIKRLIINGQGSSSLRLSDVRVSTLLGFLPLLLKSDFSEALVIGFGTGATSNILSRHVKTTTVEIEPKVVKTAKYFKMINDGVIGNQNHNIVYNDARNYLANTHKKFDIIINHPLDPWQSFSSLLFTKEFLEIVKNRLASDGLYVQWLPIYNLKPNDFKDFCCTFSSVFPYQVMFINLRDNEKIDYVIEDENRNSIYMGTENPGYGGELIVIGSDKAINPNVIINNFGLLSEYDRNFLKLTSLDSPESVTNLLLLKNNDIKAYGKGARLITDDRPSLEFSTPLINIKGLKNTVLVDVLDYLRQRKDP